MRKNDIIIRLEEKKDYEVVENLAREAFWNVYRPGCMEHYLIRVLRDYENFLPELDYVMELDGEIIGQIMFCKSHIDADDGRSIPTLTFGPISIAPEFKRKGYGKLLLDYALDEARELGYGAILIEGNIDFYGKSGFTYASQFGIRYHGMPEGEDAPFFLCMELVDGYLDGITGEYTDPEGYDVDDADVEEFDKTFPYKEKLVLPGQLF